MRVCWRQVAPGEIDHELLWLSVSLGGLAMAATWLTLGLHWPQCLFLKLTGHPCLTCGATRAAIQFFHGHFANALRWNPLAFFAFCGIAIFDAYAFAVLITRRPRLRISSLTNSERQFWRAAFITLLAANWIYLLISWRG